MKAVIFSHLQNKMKQYIIGYKHKQSNKTKTSRYLPTK